MDREKERANSENNFKDRGKSPWKKVSSESKFKIMFWDSKAFKKIKYLRYFHDKVLVNTINK